MLNFSFSRGRYEKGKNQRVNRLYEYLPIEVSVLF